MATAVEAIVLAAGGSTRLGRPKALLDLDGRTPLGLILDALGAAGIDRGVVVVGTHAEALAEAHDPAPLSFVRNLAPERGRTGSIQVGVSHTSAGSDLLLWPVDRPLASAATVRALLDARSGAEWDLLVPETGGGRGHPILLSARLRSRILSSPEDASLREALAAPGSKRRQVPVSDPGIHFNLDTDGAVEAALLWWRSARAAG
jgi:molybdenum cofactor cytidylyltransferase